MRNLLFIFIVQILFIANLNAANDSILVIKRINLEGNHITHDKIILRELTFKIGDTLSIHNYSIQKEKSSQNLMNISLFNFVNFSEDITNNEISINIRLTERWYIWPIPVFDLADRNFNTWWKTKDFNRINFGVDLAIFNFRGRNETLDLLLSLGYDEKYGIVYKIPYINKKQTLGLVISGNYIRSHEIALKDSNNKVIFLKDQINYPKQSVNTSIGITYRRNIHNFHTFQLEYEKFHFEDTLAKLNPEYTLSKNTENQYFSFYYQYKNDYRDYKPYPLKGHYFDIEIHKYGMDFIDGSKVNLASIKST